MTPQSPTFVTATVGESSLTLFIENFTAILFSFFDFHIFFKVATMLPFRLRTPYALALDRVTRRHRLGMMFWYGLLSNFFTVACQESRSKKARQNVASAPSKRHSSRCQTVATRSALPSRRARPRTGAKVLHLRKRRRCCRVSDD